MECTTIRGPVSNIAIYDGTDWDSLNGGVEFEVIAASVDSTTNTIYVLCTSDNTDELPLFLWRPSNGICSFVIHYSRKLVTSKTTKEKKRSPFQLLVITSVQTQKLSEITQFFQIIIRY